MRARKRLRSAALPVRGPFCFRIAYLIRAAFTHLGYILPGVTPGSLDSAVDFAPTLRGLRRAALELRVPDGVCRSVAVVLHERRLASPPRSHACGGSREKDAENLPRINPRLPIWIAVIDFVFTAESEFLAAIDRKLAARG